MPARTHVPARHRSGRSARGRRTAPGRGGASPWLISTAAPGARCAFRSGSCSRVAGALACTSDRRRSLLAGSAVAVLGEALRIWAAGHLNKSREVTSSGPYRWFAHPLYVGSSIMGVGLAIASGSLAVAALDRAVSGCDDHRRDPERGGISARRSSATSTIATGAARSARATRAARTRRFTLAQAIANREHRAVGGLVLAVLLLVSEGNV